MVASLEVQQQQPVGDFSNSMKAAAANGGHAFHEVFGQPLSPDTPEGRIMKAEEDIMKTLTSGQAAPDVRRTSSKYGFRFLKHEKQVLEKWYEEHDGRTAPIHVRKDWTAVWNEHRRKSKQPHCEVSHQQVKQWFENTRRTRNHKTKVTSYKVANTTYNMQQNYEYGGAVVAPTPQSPSALNPRFYLATTTEKMHAAINEASMVVSKHMDRIHQQAGSDLSATPSSSLETSPPLGGGAHFKWDEANLKSIVENLLVQMDNHPCTAIPSPCTVMPPQTYRFQVFKQLLDTDRQIEPEWIAIKQGLGTLKQNPTDETAFHHVTQLVDMYMMKFDQIAAAKAKIMIDMVGSMPVLPNATCNGQHDSKGRAAIKKEGEVDAAGGHKNNNIWMQPGWSSHSDSKMYMFEGCFLENEMRANMFLGVPLHASALASAVCFSLESGEEQRLTSAQAQSLVRLYEATALEELKALAAFSPAADQLMEHSLNLSLAFLKGLRTCLPLPLFIKCMTNFTQAHYLFAASSLIKFNDEV
mmetsp:Transcript_2701/g.6474  ORF Transcript_2701/g.6474 Transcript_2701/m.6474 type:complete len:526 (+) Transcript_2701:286-1863(+)|eukprot:CAMPEP_0198237570 /NCGR_PEP_ID=MMETSP1446-20131203/3355_1 /TAXON_ID=1461542 ORGANISM="Unidentified sp, Strain CCMP2111" /NCGR_SAMPLE_ID=MMETSP1446 /ASSEMBLY_ACC=CAM_ASM_001112 /LENGTH=525 /DNA_ID=CAMNT_0043919739 /DNA_START=519 /DNA_END=2096 /DNA_ORIENTATION=+